MHPFRVFACAGAPLLIRLCPVQVKRCDEMLRKLRFFGEQIAKADLVALPRTTREKAYELDELEVKLEELERELLEQQEILVPEIRDSVVIGVNGVETLRRSHRCARGGRVGWGHTTHCGTPLTAPTSAHAAS